MHNTAVRMYSKDVLSLKDIIDPELETKIDRFGESNTSCRGSIQTMKEIIHLIANNPECLKDENGNEITNPSINVETTFGYSEGIFELLCAKVKELINMMRHADEDNEEIHPLSIGSIENVGMSLFRRIYYVANEKAIRAKAGAVYYPFIVVDKDLLHIMYHLFLKIYFSPLCDFLVPMYVYSAIPLCCKKNVVRFNVKYPINRIADPELDQYHLYGGVMRLKMNNPPGTTPENYE